MGRCEAQGRPRQGGADFPHCRGGEIVQADKAAQGENVNPAWTSMGGRSAKDRQSTDKSQAQGSCARYHHIGRRPRITWVSVDGVWTAMYESNQRSKSHNKSL